MISLIALAIIKPQDNPVERFDQYIRSAKTISVDLELKHSGVSNLGKGSFQAKNSGFLLFKMKWGPSDYSFSITPEYVVSIEHGNKVYREYGPVGRMFVPDSDISRTAEYGLPIALVAGSLNSMVPDGVRLKPGPKSTHEGATVDTAVAEYATQTGQISVTAKVDSAGRLVHYQTKMTGGGPTTTIEVSLANYRINTDIEDSDFVTPLPNGYVPETLPPASYPINFGEKLPMDGWTPLAGAESFAGLTRDKVLFVAISDSDCDVSRRSAQAVDQLCNQLKSKGVACAAITLDASDMQAPVFRTLPNYFDPSGKASDRLRVPGTPLFLMVSPKGVVHRVWLGFDNAKVGEFTADVLGWIEKAKE